MSILKIEVIEGRDLLSVASDGTCDPYVVCIVGNKQKKTRVIKNTLNPKWRIGSQSETFTFKKVNPKVKEVIIRCLDHTWLSSGERLGQIKILLSELEDGKEREEWHKLQPQKAGDRVSGELRVKIQFVSEKSHRRQMSLSGEVKLPPLLAAIRNKSLANLEELLKLGVDIHATDQFGECALHWAAAMNDLSENTTRILIRLLEQSNANVNLANIDGNTPFHIFCKKFSAPDVERPFKLFIERGAQVNKQNNAGETPMHQAVFNSTMSHLMVTYLVKYGASVNLPNNKGETPLYYAIRMGATQLVSLLIRNGADITRAKEATLSPYEVAIEGGFPRIADILKDTKEMIEWLEKIDMIKYKNIFLENELRVYLLPDVTKDQWTKWITNEKDRKIIMDTINKTAVTEKYKEQKEKVQKDRQLRRHESNLRRTLQQSALLSKNSNASSSRLTQSSDSNLISSEQWEIDPSDLEYTQSLGSGASGEVFRGYYKGEEVAIKVLKSCETEKEIEEFKKEFAVLMRVREPHVVHLYGAGIKGRLLMVMEFCHRGSLYDVLRDESIEFGWERFFHFASEVVTAVSELHRNNVLHRDLKTLNLLVTEDWQVRICDFGLSRFDTSTNIETLKKCRGTYPYIAPEVYNCERFVPQSDVYAIGIILWEMANRVIKGKYEKPYSEYKQFQFDFQILIQACTMNLRPTIPPQCPTELAELIKQCLLPDKNARPTTEQLLEKLNSLKEHYKKNVAAWNQACVTSSTTNSDLKLSELKANAEAAIKEDGVSAKNRAPPVQ
jgi:ankyrin repeat protein/tRNA A-37 threonylcarbamoyl transferase component Bud32